MSLAAPGPSPTTTAVVFFDTLPGRLATVRLDDLLGPFAAVVLERAGDDDRLARERLGHVLDLGAFEVDARLAQLLDDARGSVRRRTTRARAAAMIGPMPSTSATSSADAASSASRCPKCRASASAPAGPRWRMFSPTSRLASGRCFDASMASRRLRDRDLAEALELAQLVVVEEVDVGDVVQHVELAEQADGALAEALDVHRAA